MRRAAFFLNPLLTQGARRRTAIDRCAALLRERGCAVEMQNTLSAYSAGDQAREAVESGCDAVFTCGGDGTFFQVLQGVAGSDAAVGIIPMGTGNVLAQNLRLPKDPVAAFQAQINAAPVSIPLGEAICAPLSATANENRERRWYFTIAAGVGLHAALMNLAPNGNGKRLLGRAAYFAGGFRLLLSHPMQAFEVEITSSSGSIQKMHACELLGVRVPQINVWRSGGDLRATHLRVAIVPRAGRVGLGHAMFHALFTGKQANPQGRETRLPYPRYEDAIQIAAKPVETNQKLRSLVEADGEVIGTGPATFRMSKKRLNLLWPRG